MERKKYSINLLLLVICFMTILPKIYAQQSSQDIIYEAFSRGKMDVWHNVMTQIEQESIYTDNNNELVNLYYGYVAWLISIKDFDKAEIYIEKAELLLNNLLIEEAVNPTAIAYKGAFIAFEIGVSNLKAIYLGSKSVNLIDKSLELDSTNVQGLIEKGNSMYYCPAAFGGDKMEAIIHYKKAISYMELYNMTHNNWLYLNTMTALGQAYEGTNQIQKAKVCYEKIIKFKPNYMWVEEELYPDMLERHNLK